MMQQTHSELEVMRRPSEAQVAKREAEATRLKRELEAWSALLELRIHLEGALGFGHRLPAGDAHVAMCDADAELSTEVKAATERNAALLATLLAVQRRSAQRCDIPVESTVSKVGEVGDRSEADAWAAIDAQLQPVMSWAVNVADEWKEKTRLDARRSFKVLDQSLATQMQAVADVDQTKVRRRCMPPPGKHKIFGAVPPGSTSTAAGSDAQATEEGVDGMQENSAEMDVYDDHEFYVHLLREVLAGGSNSDGPSIGKDRDVQAELQGRRALKKKARADVERRASKGRKIRYVPIEKLQNFMAPRSRSALKSGDDGEAAALEGAAAEALVQSLFAAARAA